jgi:hypothetical protein
MMPEGELPERPRGALTTKNTAHPKERSWYERPHEELVGEIKSALAAKRTKYEKQGGPFDPVRWLGNRLVEEALGSGVPANRPVLALVHAWDAISYPYIQSEDVRFDIRSRVKRTAGMYGPTIILEPPAVKLLDAMAEAVDVPRTRGEATVDSLEHVRIDEPQAAAYHRRYAEQIIRKHIRRTGTAIMVDGIQLSPEEVAAEQQKFSPAVDIPIDKVKAADVFTDYFRTKV